MQINQVSEHFKRSELACSHCGECRVVWELVETLEELRQRIQIPGQPERALVVESGYRCPAHNVAVGGAADSQHVHGTAADLYVIGMTSRDLYAIAAGIHGVKGLGVSDHRPSLHVDIRESVTLARWCYDVAGKTIAWYNAPGSLA